MGIGEILGQALDEKRTKPRVGMTVICFVDGPTDGRTCSAKVVRVHDRDRVDLQLRTGELVTATYAGASSAPRPPQSWDFIV